MSRARAQMSGEMADKSDRGASGIFSASFEPADLLVELLERAATGRLSVHSRLGTGRCWLKGGQVVDAELGTLRGELALKCFLSVHGGEYRFEEGAVERERAIRSDTRDVIAQATRRDSDWLAVMEKLPALGTQLVINHARIKARPELLEPGDKELIELATEGSTVFELVDFSDLEPVEVLRRVTRLLDGELVRARSTPVVDDEPPASSSQKGAPVNLARPDFPAQGKLPRDLASSTGGRAHEAAPTRVAKQVSPSSPLKSGSTQQAVLVTPSIPVTARDSDMRPKASAISSAPPGSRSSSAPRSSAPPSSTPRSSAPPSSAPPPSGPSSSVPPSGNPRSSAPEIVTSSSVPPAPASSGRAGQGTSQPERASQPGGVAVLRAPVVLSDVQAKARRDEFSRGRTLIGQPAYRPSAPVAARGSASEAVAQQPGKTREPEVRAESREDSAVEGFGQHQRRGPGQRLAKLPAARALKVSKKPADLRVRRVDKSVWLVAVPGAWAATAVLGVAYAAAARPWAGAMLVILLSMLAVSQPMLIYRMWASIQDERVPVSPRQAVLRLLIPVYGFYWIFKVLPGYAAPYNAFLTRHRIETAPRLSKHMILVSMFVPGIGIFASFLVVNRICDGINAIATHFSSGEPTSQAAAKREAEE